MVCKIYGTSSDNLHYSPIGKKKKKKAQEYLSFDLL